MTKETQCSAKEQANRFMSEFSKETDRAAGIVSAAILDSTLESVLKSHLVEPTKSGSDTLFDGPNAPLSSFSAKIDLAFRLGLISIDMAKSLHIVRKIRNTFAHEIAGCDFVTPTVVKLTNQLTTIVLGDVEDLKKECIKFDAGPRGDFQMALSFIIWWFWCGSFLQGIKRLPEKKRELFDSKDGNRQTF